jgi:hypothetical protein
MKSSSDNEPIPRLAPDERLPPYAYAPRRYPHPTGDPSGHRFGVEPAVRCANTPKAFTCHGTPVPLSLVDSPLAATHSASASTRSFSLE